MSEIRSQSKEAADREDNLTLIFKSSPIGMIILNDDMTISEINKASLKIINKKSDEILGKKFGEAFQCLGSFGSEKGCGFGKHCAVCDFRKAALEAIEEEKTTENLEFSKVFLQGDQQVEKWFVSSFTSIYLNDRRKVFVSLVDITDNKAKEMAALEAKQKAEEASRVKSEFLANMSHEIRTPVSGIIGMIDITLMKGLDQEQKENLLTAKSCASLLLNIINDLLDFSKMEAKKLVMENISFDLKELVEKTIKLNSVCAAKKGLELNYSVSSAIPHQLSGDPNRLQQILHNLIDNAIKFTEKGRVTVSVTGGEQTNDSVELTFMIADTGIGISDEDKGKLFKSFSQVDGSTARKYGGTGLGLAISKHLVEMMDGTIWVESEPGKGSQFYFIVKLQSEKNTNESLPAMTPLEQPNGRMKILLVEDNTVSQKVLCKMLKEKGHQVELANNGMEAVRLHSAENYDAILMDVYMPEMDGIEATKRIREKEGLKKHTPIIALTAYAPHADKDQFIALGMDEHLSKPFKMEELFYLLDCIFEKKQTYSI
jgi:signal transduction histidine kinase/ActR/RegA family two-component response regulator